MWHLEFLLSRHPGMDFTEMALHLAGVPFKPLGYRYSREVALELLANGGKAVQ